MQSDWDTLTLGEIATNESRRFNFENKDEVVFINTGDVSEGKFLVKTYTSSKGLPGQAKKAIEANDILFTEIRPANKRYAFVDFDAIDYVVSTKFMVIKAGKLLLPEYLYIVLTSNAMLREFQHVAESRSGTFPQITFGAVSYVPIKIPPLQTQNKIAHILSSLDDKIELNRKMNQTLDEMAQVLFKSWFVDFDPVHAKATATGDVELEKAAGTLGVSKEVLALFPSEFEESEMGMIPLGWEVKTIKDFGRVVTGKTPPKKVEDAYNSFGKPFITPTDVDDSLFVTSTNRHLSESGELAIKNTVITAGSICVTCIGSQMGKTIISPYDACTNQQINSIIVNDEHIRSYLFCNLRSRKNEIFLMGSSGSTMPLLNKSSFEKMKVLLPSQQLLEGFSAQIKDKLALVLENDLQSMTLSKTRDTLLPRLLSGELDVSNMEVPNG